jgi:hypothetical protein
MEMETKTIIDTCLMSRACRMASGKLAYLGQREVDPCDDAALYLLWTCRAIIEFEQHQSDPDDEREIVGDDVQELADLFLEAAREGTTTQAIIKQREQQSYILNLEAEQSGPLDARPLLRDLKAIREKRAELDRVRKDLWPQHEAIVAKLVELHQQTGNDKISVKGVLAVGFDDQAMRAKYDPEKWPGIVKWAGETGNEHILQRRITDAKVVDLVANGVALPDGLSLEQFVKVSIRKG